MIGAKIKELKGKIRISKEAQGIIVQILLFLGGFLLMPVSFLFETHPFALALLGASKRNAPFVFVGAVSSVLLIMDAEPLYIVALVALLGLRIAGSFVKKPKETELSLGQKQGMRVLEHLFSEDKELRVAVTGLTALGVSIYRVIANGYVYYDVFVLIFFTALTAILTYCFCGVFDGRVRDNTFLLGIGSILFCLVYALSEREIKGIDVAIIISYAAVLYISKSISGVYGAVIGLALGSAQGGVLGAVLGICGIVSGLLWTVSPYLAIMSAFVLGMGYAISIEGYEAIVYYMPELLAVSLIMYPLLRFEVIPKLNIAKREEKQTIESYSSRNENEEIKSKVDSLCLTLKDVSKMIRSVSKKTKSPDRRGYTEIALSVCESYCYSCPKEEICWQRDVTTTQENIDKMGGAMFSSSLVTKKDVDERFLHRCPNIEKIIEELNRKIRDISKQGVRNDKLDVSSQDYDAISRMLSAMASEGDSEVENALSDKALRACVRCGLACRELQVIGKRKITIIATGVDIEKSRCTAEELRQELERSLEMKLKEPQLTGDASCAVMKIERENNLSITCYTASVPKNEGEENGDSLCFFEGADGREYAIICDGMGSGRDAHLTSSMCTEFLKKMLTVSKEKEIALSMLNSLVRAKNTECSSTVDLLEIDLISKEGRLVKSGASPSFIIRGDEVHKLQSKTAPIGIMKSLDAEQLSFNMNSGDACIMVSDGVISSKQDTSWLTELLKETDMEKIDELPKRIISEAKRRGKNNDDMSAMAVVIN